MTPTPKETNSQCSKKCKDGIIQKENGGYFCPDCTKQPKESERDKRIKPYCSMHYELFDGGIKNDELPYSDPKNCVHCTKESVKPDEEYEKMSRQEKHEYILKQAVADGDMKLAMYHLDWQTIMKDAVMNRPTSFGLSNGQEFYEWGGITEWRNGTDCIMSAVIQAMREAGVFSQNSYQRGKESGFSEGDVAELRNKMVYSRVEADILADDYDVFDGARKLTAKTMLDAFDDTLKKINARKQSDDQPKS